MTVSQYSKEIVKDINSVLSELRTNNLIRDENGITQHSLVGNAVGLTFHGKSDVSGIVYDKHISCSQIIDILLSARQYTVLLYDKSLIQAEFIIGTDGLLKERLVFIKKHNRIWLKSEIEKYEAIDEDWFSDEMGIPVMLRIDYDPQSQKDRKHPSAHITFSNHSSCRIPMKGAISFSEFVKFIFLQFYDIELQIPEYRLDEVDTITEAEKKLIHLNWE